MKQQITQIINEVYSDLAQACGDDFDAENLADYVGDRMHDESAEFRALPYAQKRTLVLDICKNYF